VLLALDAEADSDAEQVVGIVICCWSARECSTFRISTKKSPPAANTTWQTDELVIAKIESIPMVVCGSTSKFLPHAGSNCNPRTGLSRQTLAIGIPRQRLLPSPVGHQQVDGQEHHRDRRRSRSSGRSA
jgi:hypothetical protein